MTWTPSVKMGARDRRSSVFDYWSPTAAWFGLSLHLSGSSWNPLFFGSGRSCYLWLISPYNALAYFLRVNMFWRGNYKHNHPSLTGGWMSAGRVSLWPPPSTLHHSQCDLPLIQSSSINLLSVCCTGTREWINIHKRRIMWMLNCK